MLEITAKTEKETTTLFVSGKIDSANSAEFEQKAEQNDTTDRLILDIEKLEYISSAGLRVILKIRKKHPDLEVINASSEVYEIFDMTGFTEMMNVKRAYREISVDGCEVIGQGANGKVYRIDPDTVVKVYLNPNSLGEIEHEREVARKALVLGIPTAISYDVVKVGDHYASMFEMLNAKSFSKLLDEHPEKTDEYAVRYIDLLKLIHGTLVPKGDLPDWREVFIGWVKDLQNYLPTDIYEKLLALATAIPQDDHMIHGDYHTKNIMLQNDEVILIDMDTLAVGHPILEFASMYNAYQGFCSLDHDVIRNFLGIDYEVAKKLWKKSLELYYGTKDQEKLAYHENQAKVAGLVRLYRRCIRRNVEKELQEYCQNELCRLIPTLSSFVD